MVGTLGKGERDPRWIDDLFVYYDRVEGETGICYVERFDGARRQWLKLMRRRATTSATSFFRAMGATVAQILASIWMGK